jgi:iron complex outermembrane receptor protein
MRAYVAGMKNRSLSDRLTLNVEGFYYDYRNYQVSARNPITSQNNVYNATKAEVYGGQIDLTYNVTADDRLTASLVALHAKAITLVTPAGNFDGYDLPYSPSETAHASYLHTFRIATGAVVDALLNYAYMSSRWGFYTHAAGTYIAADSKVDVDVTYRAASRRWAFSVWGRNLANSAVMTSGISGAIPGPAAFDYQPPRTYGVRLSANF